MDYNIGSQKKGIIYTSDAGLIDHKSWLFFTGLLTPLPLKRDFDFRTYSMLRQITLSPGQIV